MAFYGPSSSLVMDSDGIVLSGFDSDGYSTSNSATWQSTMIKVENPYPSVSQHFGVNLAMGYGKILVQSIFEAGTSASHVYAFDYDGNFIDSIPLPSDQGYNPSLPAFVNSNWGSLIATGNGRIAIATNGYRQDLGGRSFPNNLKQTGNIALYDMNLNYIKTLFPSQWNNTQNAAVAAMDTISTGGESHELKISNGKVIFLSKDFKDSQGVPLGDSQDGRVVIFDLFDWDSGEETYIYPRIQKDTSNQGLKSLAVAHNRIFVGVTEGYDSGSSANMGNIGVYDLHSGGLIRTIQNPLDTGDLTSGDFFGGNLGAGAGRLCVGEPGDDGIFIFDLNGEVIKEEFNPAEGWSNNLVLPVGVTSIIENEKIYVPVKNTAGIKDESRIYVLDLDGNVLGFVHEDDSDFSRKNDNFGDDMLAADGNMLVVGNYRDSNSTTGESQKGSIYIFTIGDETYSNYVDNVMDLKR